MNPIKAKVAALRKYKKGEVFWTPIGELSGELTDFLFKNDVLMTTNNQYFLIWKGYEGYLKWRELKQDAMNIFFKPSFEYRRLKNSVNEKDFVSSLMLHKVSILPKVLRSIAEWDSFYIDIQPMEDEIVEVETTDALRNQLESICIKVLYKHLTEEEVTNLLFR